MDFNNNKYLSYFFLKKKKEKYLGYLMLEKVVIKKKLHFNFEK